jgi:hypothetical protein
MIECLEKDVQSCGYDAAAVPVTVAPKSDEPEKRFVHNNEGNQDSLTDSSNAKPTTSIYHRHPRRWAWADVLGSFFLIYNTSSVLNSPAYI